MAGVVQEAGLMECRKYYKDCHEGSFIFKFSDNGEVFDLQHGLVGHLEK